MRIQKKRHFQFFISAEPDEISLPQGSPVPGKKSSESSAKEDSGIPKVAAASAHSLPKQHLDDVFIKLQIQKVKPLTGVLGRNSVPINIFLLFFFFFLKLLGPSFKL